MRNLKKPLTFSEQVDKLRQHGMLIDDETKAIESLKMVNYYRFTGYALQFRASAHQSDYVEGTSFGQVLRIYEFDEALRNILRKHIETIEIYFRTQISYGFSLAKCAQSPHNQHYDESNFYNKRGYREVMGSFTREQNYHADSLIVKHHMKKYHGELPLWVMVELMSFSNLSKLYSSMYYSEKDAIAKKVGCGRGLLENNLHCLSILRNKCAHAARLYNTTFSPPARFSQKFLRSHPEVYNDTLFAYILVVLMRLPHTRSKVSFATELTMLVEEFKADIDMSFIGFPENYAKLLAEYVCQSRVTR